MLSCIESSVIMYLVKGYHVFVKRVLACRIKDFLCWNVYYVNPLTSSPIQEIKSAEITSKQSELEGLVNEHEALQNHIEKNNCTSLRRPVWSHDNCVILIFGVDNQQDLNYRDYMLLYKRMYHSP